MNKKKELADAIKTMEVRTITVINTYPVNLTCPRHDNEVHLVYCKTNQCGFFDSVTYYDGEVADYIHCSVFCLYDEERDKDHKYTHEHQVRADK